MVVHLERACSNLRLVVLAFGLVIAAACTPTGPVPSGGVPDPGLPTPVSWQSYSGVSCVATGECVAVGNDSARWDGTRWTEARPPWNPQPRTAPTVDRQPYLAPPPRKSDVSCVTAAWCMALVTGESRMPEAWIGDGLTWRQVTVPTTAYTVLPIAVSCVSTSFCLARGGAVTLRWDGLRWVHVYAPAAGRFVQDLSCASPTFCVAVGGQGYIYVEPTFAQRWDGTAWRAEDLAPAGNPSTLFSVSCPSVDLCRAAGLPSAVVTRTAGGWSSVPLPDGLQYLVSLTCPSATMCVAIGVGPETSRTFHVGRLTPAGWSPLIDVPGEWAAASVACATAERCAMVGGTFSLLGGDQVTDVTPPRPPGPPVARLTDVSCVDDGGSPWCLAIGVARGSDGFDRYISATGDGTAWQIQVPPVAMNPYGPQVPGRPDLHTVSCVRRNLCLATGSDWEPGPYGTVEIGAVYRWNGAGWARTEDPVSWRPGGYAQVACAPDGCVAAVAPRPDGTGPVPGSAAVAIGVPDGAGIRWEGVNDAAADLARVEFSCASTVRCVGVTGPPRNDGSAEVHEVVSWDGRTSTVVDAAAVAGIGAARDAACAPDGSCVVVGPRGSVEVRADGTVSPVRPAPAATYLLSVSCTAANRCTAVANATTDPTANPQAAPDPVLVTWDGQRWTRQAGVRLRLTATYPDPGALSCIGAACVQVGGTGPYSAFNDPVASAPAAQRLPN